VHPAHHTTEAASCTRACSRRPSHACQGLYQVSQGTPFYKTLCLATDDEELDCVASKRKILNWTPLAWLNSLSHHTGFSTSEAFNKDKVIQDWTVCNCQQLGLPIPHLQTFRHDACACKRFAIDEFGDHLHCCTRAQRRELTSTYSPPFSGYSP
jgi:hypothetical protein